MNWFNFLLPLLTPLSSQQQFQSQLTHALTISQLEYHRIVYREFQNEVEFNLLAPSQSPTKIILSTLKNPYWQVSSLQQIQKIAKIKNQTVTTIDLSINHPYATLENN